MWGLGVCGALPTPSGVVQGRRWPPFVLLGAHVASGVHVPAC
jgi:hypothetical protein